MRLAGREPGAAHRLERRHWRALAEVRAMFRRALGDQAPDVRNSPPDRRPNSDDDQAGDLLDSVIAQLVALSFRPTASTSATPTPAST
eukprot:2349063-Pyramimonas_sp.AAC.1